MQVIPKAGMRWGLIILGVSWLLFTACENQDTPGVPVTGSFISPVPYASLSNNQEVLVTVALSGPVRSANLFTDGIFQTEMDTGSLTCTWTPKNLSAGNHELSCVVWSMSGVKSTLTTPIRVMLNLGDRFQGGTIFFLDETGQHGLIAAEQDLEITGNALFFWGPESILEASDSVNGKNNTVLMAAASANATFAGFAFQKGYNQNGYDDWYIPAKKELVLLAQNRWKAVDFPSDSSNAYYWSSTECCRIKACAVNVADSTAAITTKIDHEFRIRPIRQF